MQVVIGVRNTQITKTLININMSPEELRKLGIDCIEFTAIPKQDYYERHLDNGGAEDYCNRVFFANDINSLKEYYIDCTVDVITKPIDKEKWKEVEKYITENKLPEHDLYYTNNSAKKRIIKEVKDVLKNPKYRDHFDETVRYNLRKEISLRQPPYNTLPVEKIINDKDCWLFY